MSSLLTRLGALWATARRALASRQELVLANLALRQQLAVLRKETPRPAVRTVDRLFTTQPTAAWVSQQLREACPFDTAPAFLHRDRDGIYGDAVSDTLKAMGIEEVLSAPRSPWQNPYCERVIGTLRRELFNHVIVTGEARARALLKEYVEYYYGSRTHLVLVKDAPNERGVELPAAGPVHTREVLGGLHHRYFRRAA
jgi:hypothetical protein